MSLIIDAGHQGQGFDPGAVGNGIIEADLVLKISLYQIKRFVELGVPVQLTRTKTQKLTNAERAKLVRNSGAKHCMSNHINAGGGDGAEVIYSIHAKPKFAQTVLDALVAAGQNPRKIFTRTTANAKHDYYYMHRDTGAVETIIVEYGFLDSKKDDVMQLKNDWQLYAEAVVKAYCAYACYKYVAPGRNDRIQESNVKDANVFRLQSAPKSEAEAAQLVKSLVEKGIYSYAEAKVFVDGTRVQSGAYRGADAYKRARAAAEKAINENYLNFVSLVGFKE